MIYQDPYDILVERHDACVPIGFVGIEQDTRARQKLVAILKNPKFIYLSTERACIARLTTCFRRLTIAESCEINCIFSRIRLVDEIEAEREQRK